jgi:hypothetical protein
MKDWSFTRPLQVGIFDENILNYPNKSDYNAQSFFVFLKYDTILREYD